MDVSPPRPRPVQRSVNECDRALGVIARKLKDPSKRTPTETEDVLLELADRWLDTRLQITLYDAAA